MSLILRQGLDADRQNIVFSNGELVWTTDTQRLYVGDGITQGGIDILSSLHNHDDRYYLKSIVDNLLSAKLDITTFDSHVNDLTIHRTINDSGISTTDLWSAAKIINSLNQKADIGHIHDDRYYTKNEVDALQSDENVKVDDTDSAAGYLTDKLFGNAGINLSVNTISFPDNVLQIDADVWVDTINGVSMPVYMNTSKTNKIHSVETGHYIWMEATIATNDWVEVGTARDADTGYIMPFDGTIIAGSIHCENTNGNTLGIRLYQNNTNIGNIFTVSGTGQYSFSDTTFNIDFSAGDKLRLRGNNVGGQIQDTLISLFIKWRKA